MKITTHGDNLTKLMRLRFVNAYLVREPDGLTLVDTMISGSAKGIIAAAEQAGAPIVRIVLTHAHADHVGSVDALVERLPDAELSISRRDARFLEGDKRLDRDEPQSKLRGGYPIIGMASWDGPTIVRSAKALRALDPARLATGHGPVVESPLPAMDAALAKAGG